MRLLGTKSPSSKASDRFLNPTMPVEVAPVLLNIRNQEWVHQRILLVYGRAGPIDFPFESKITVDHHANNFPQTSWPIFNSFFKCLVHLDPGQNNLQFTFNPPVGLEYLGPVTTSFQINYIPLLQNPPLHLAILVSKDSNFVIDAPPQKQNNLDAVKAKFRCAAYLWQAFTAEQMERNGFGRRIFRLEENWEQDTLTNQDNSLRQTAKIHIIPTNYTREELLDPERAQQYHPPPGTPPTKKEDLFSIFLESLQEYGAPFNKECYVAGLILDSHYDPEMQLIRGHAALGGGSGNIRLGIFGSHTTHAWPRFLEEVVTCFQDDTKIDKRILGNDNNEGETYWKCCNIGIGAMLHEVGHALTLPHSYSGIMSRGFNNLNRTFTVKEPRNPKPITADDEDGSHWHRCDVVRFRCHPCFRLASDSPKRIDLRHLSPDFWPLHDSVLIRCNAGISLMEIHLNDKYKYHLEFIDGDHPGDVKLTVSSVKQRTNWQNGQKIRLHVVAPNQSENTIENFESFLNDHQIILPSVGFALKSAKLGVGSGIKFQVLFKNPLLPANAVGKPKQKLPNTPYLTNIRVNAGDFIDGIKFFWSDNTQSSHGGEGGIPHDFPLEEDELIVSLLVRSGAWIDGLEIRTNRGRTSGWLGGQGGSLHVLDVPSGYEIVGLYGSCDCVLDSLGIIYVENKDGWGP
ncbi:hypothetical protein G9A89_012816 [Geosiphon pyriformis]|nr:hypothetical protein G9A89_012816 [Geosiphon pyriformis]